jgi:hypothetical protein
MKICYISLLVSNSKGFQNIIYFECLKDYSQAEQLQTKVSGQYVEEILLNVNKVYSIFLYACTPNVVFM